MLRLESAWLSSNDVRAELARRRMPHWKLAHVIGISPARLSSFMSGKKQAPMMTIEKIEDYFEMQSGSLVIKCPG